MNPLKTQAVPKVSVAELAKRWWERLRGRDIEGLQELCAPTAVVETVASGFVLQSASDYAEFFRYLDRLYVHFTTVSSTHTNHIVEGDQAAISSTSILRYMGGLPTRAEPGALTRMEGLAFFRASGSVLDRMVSYGDFRSILGFAEEQASGSDAPALVLAKGKSGRALQPRPYSNRRWVDLHPLVDALFEEVNHHRPDGIASHCIQEVVMRDLPLPRLLRGRKAVQDFFRFLFTMIPDVQFERRNVIADGTQAAVEWALQGTVRGQLFPGALSEVPVQLRGASLLWCKRDQIAQVTSYWDWASLEEQVKSPAGKLETRARRNGRRRSRT